MAEARRSLELNPKLVAGYISLGVLLDDEDKLDEASALYRTAIELEPMAAPAHSNIGFILKRQGRLDESLKAASPTTSMPPFPMTTLVSRPTVFASCYG